MTSTLTSLTPSVQRCLTPRSSGATTAWRAGHQALGLRPILRLLSSASCRCRPLISNVRPPPGRRLEVQLVILISCCIMGTEYSRLKLDERSAGPRAWPGPPGACILVSLAGSPSTMKSHVALAVVLPLQACSPAPPPPRSNSPLQSPGSFVHARQPLAASFRSRSAVASKKLSGAVMLTARQRSKFRSASMTRCWGADLPTGLRSCVA